MAQLNDLLVMGQSTLLGPVTVSSQSTFLGLMSIQNNIASTKKDWYIQNTSNFPITIRSSGLLILMSGENCTTANLNTIKTVNSNNEAVGDQESLYLVADGNIYARSNVDGTMYSATLLDANGDTTLPGHLSLAPNKNITCTPTANNQEWSIDVGNTTYTGSTWHVWSGRLSQSIFMCYADDAKCKAFGMMEAASFYATSDARLKENFQEFISKKSILDLPIYKFDFINGSKNQIGCKAQDLQEICPEIVNEDNDGYLSIQESKIVYLLIEEIKKLKDEINIVKGLV